MSAPRRTPDADADADEHETTTILVSEAGLLDTSTVILLGRVAHPEHLPDELLVSTITLAELSVGPHVARDDVSRAARQAHLQQAEADFEPLPFDAAAARMFGVVAAGLRASGRKPGARAYDALIASVAMANGLPVVTANPRDFRGIRGLSVIEVELED
ncbi:type II toxin-antitoxin system VapC family toxin [Herbiconiux moechotypicola]|uniref:Ribonuclease VapC n=1 Tax=Herbiconiux moechotypicola TaxID=637393 RepID=A0ABN3DYG5_9MICO|nr:type II toxin-antitoxin system VapC family toxin [Herbiconiux moechotypicola]MCS5730753.1 type II toxin-antitoxin system VapC family toxin [Herbiconiux moechotypicola]